MKTLTKIKLAAAFVGAAPLAAFFIDEEIHRDDKSAICSAINSQIRQAYSVSANQMSAPGTVETTARYTMTDAESPYLINTPDRLRCPRIAIQ